MVHHSFTPQVDSSCFFVCSMYSQTERPGCFSASVTVTKSEISRRGSGVGSSAFSQVITCCIWLPRCCRTLPTRLLCQSPTNVLFPSGGEILEDIFHWPAPSGSKADCSSHVEFTLNFTERMRCVLKLCWRITSALKCSLNAGLPTGWTSDVHGAVERKTVANMFDGFTGLKDHPPWMTLAS